MVADIPTRSAEVIRAILERWHTGEKRLGWIAETSAIGRAYSLAHLLVNLRNRLPDHVPIVVVADRLHRLEALQAELRDYDLHPSPTHQRGRVLGSSIVFDGPRRLFLTSLAIPDSGNLCPGPVVLVYFADEDLGSNFLGHRGALILEGWPGAALLGFLAGHDRATPSAARRTEAAFGPCLRHFGLRAAINDGMAVGIQGLVQRALPDFWLGDDPPTTGESWTTFCEALPDLVASHWKRSSRPYRKGLVVVRRASDAAWLAHAAEYVGIDVVHRERSMPAYDLATVDSDWLSPSGFPILATCRPTALPIFPESLDVVYLAGPMSVAQTEEVLARSCRLAHGRDFVEVVDFIGVTSESRGVELPMAATENDKEALPP